MIEWVKPSEVLCDRVGGMAHLLKPWGGGNKRERGGGARSGVSFLSSFHLRSCQCQHLVASGSSPRYLLKGTQCSTGIGREEVQFHRTQLERGRGEKGELGD